MSQRMRNCCFTSYDVNEPVFNDKMKYLVYGSEYTKGEDGKEPKHHWQGYVEFNNPMSFNTVKKMLGDENPHVEARKGTAAQASAYCKKEGKWKEFGHMSAPGTRNDLMDVAKAINEGSKVSDLAQMFPEQFIKYGKGIQAYSAARLKHTAKEIRDVKVYVLYGPTGCGKTRWAYENFKDLYRLPCGTVWFDGYEGEKVLLIDDLNADPMKVDMFLQMIDRYPFQCPVKGGFTYAMWDTVIITTNIPVASWWSRIQPETHKAIMRRITDYRDFYQENADTVSTCTEVCTEVDGNTIHPPLCSRKMLTPKRPTTGKKVSIIVEDDEYA